MRLSEVKDFSVFKFKRIRIIKIHAHIGEHEVKGCLLGDKCEDCALVKHLADLGFIAGGEIEIKHASIFGFTLIVKVKGALYAICNNVAKHIEIEVIE